MQRERRGQECDTLVGKIPHLRPLCPEFDHRGYVNMQIQTLGERMKKKKKKGGKVGHQVVYFY